MDAALVPRYLRRMERFTDGDALPAALRGGVAALGNFDGFHLGHQAVVGRAMERARAEGRPCLVVSFDPHPARLFVPQAPPFALTTVVQRLRLFEDFGVDATVLIPFTRELAALRAEDFSGAWLAERIGIARAVSGGDFTFGRDRAGDVSRLAVFGAERGFAVETVDAVRDAGGETVSSTRIREALKRGDCAAAATLLTRPWTIEGTVEPGARLGRTIGVPTANLRLGDYQRPRYGVYAVRARTADGRVPDGVANIGVRPMFEPPVELLEAHLFDFADDLYGQTLAVELHAFLRDEWKLDGLDALKAQIALDCDAARAALASAPQSR